MHWSFVGSAFCFLSGLVVCFDHLVDLTHGNDLKWQNAFLMLQMPSLRMGSLSWLFLTYFSNFWSAKLPFGRYSFLFISAWSNASWEFRVPKVLDVGSQVIWHSSPLTLSVQLLSSEFFSMPKSIQKNSRIEWDQSCQCVHWSQVVRMIHDVGRACRSRTITSKIATSYGYCRWMQRLGLIFQGLGMSMARSLKNVMSQIFWHLELQAHVSSQ